MSGDSSFVSDVAGRVAVIGSRHETVMDLSGNQMFTETSHNEVHKKLQSINLSIHSNGKTYPNIILS